MMATGATNAEIGEALGLRPKTVMHYSVSMYGKLAVRGRAEAVAWGYRAAAAGVGRPRGGRVGFGGPSAAA